MRQKKLIKHETEVRYRKEFPLHKCGLSLKSAWGFGGWSWSLKVFANKSYLYLSDLVDFCLLEAKVKKKSLKDTLPANTLQVCGFIIIIFWRVEQWGCIVIIFCQRKGYSSRFMSKCNDKSEYSRNYQVLSCCICLKRSQTRLSFYIKMHSCVGSYVFSIVSSSFKNTPNVFTTLLSVSMGCAYLYLY